ncbi:MAG: alpha/beta hydrolase [Rhodospirillales bacterium]|nr:alpha/beta hydrolase [Rhodospirillales bacterium]MDP6804587.1 alpha/beta hydrolase [Rhodospirillales bacterium]
MVPAPAFLWDGPEGAALTVALAHGAGAPMDSPFMAFFAHGLGARGHRVARFEFPYMTERRASGTRRPPDRAPKLIACWRAVIKELGARNLVIGGKSLGGRIASLVADGTGVRGLLCLGFPFHAPSRSAGARIDHLAALATPTLIVQGDRDSLGARADVRDYALSAAVGLHWLADGDHGFKPRKASGRTERENWEEGLEAAAGFLEGLGDAVS